MIDKRSLLLGFGIGLIAGALLLQLMLAGREQSERLADLGRLSGEDALYTQSELDARIAEAEDRVRRQLERELAGGNAGDDGTGVGESDGTEDAGETSGDSGEQAAVDGEDTDGDGAGDGVDNGADDRVEGDITVRIKPGMTLTETAKLLEAEGVIDNADALVELMARMSTRIRAGYFTFTGNETLEEVRSIITGRPSE